jgi:hypothetical protein
MLTAWLPNSLKMPYFRSLPATPANAIAIRQEKGSLILGIREVVPRTAGLYLCKELNIARWE